MTEKYEPKRINGKYAPGSSGNPGGRPKGIAKLTRELLNKIDPETGKSKLELMVERYIDDAIRKGWTKSGNLVLERAFGKAIDRVIFEEADNFLQDEDLLALFTEEELEEYAKRYKDRNNEKSSKNGDFAS